MKGGRSTEGYFAGTDFDPPFWTLSKEVSSKFRFFFNKKFSPSDSGNKSESFGKMGFKDELGQLRFFFLPDLGS